MKLVLEYSWGDIGCSGISYIAFEYESKDKFVFDVLEKYKDHEWVDHGEWGWSKVALLDVSGDVISEDVYLDKYDIEGIERNVYTLEEWFDRNKIELKL